MTKKFNILILILLAATSFLMAQPVNLDYSFRIECDTSGYYALALTDETTSPDSNPVRQSHWYLNNEYRGEGWKFRMKRVTHGLHSVTLEAVLVGGARFRAIKSVRIPQPPDTGMTIGNGPFCEKQTAVVMHYPFSRNVSRVKWDFGDGYFSSKNPDEHIYEFANTAELNLYVTDTLGCSHKAGNRLLLIYSNRMLDQWGSSAINIYNLSPVICKGDSVKLSLMSSFISIKDKYIREIIWSTGAKDTSEIYVRDSGLYSVTVYDKLGCSAASTLTQIVLNAPEENLFEGMKNEYHLHEEVTFAPELKEEKHIGHQTASVLKNSTGEVVFKSDELAWKFIPQNTGSYILEVNHTKSLYGYSCQQTQSFIFEVK